MSDAARPAPGPPAEGPLVDRLGRTVADLRVSVTDRCNFRCTYCMPAEGLPWLPNGDRLDVAEIERLIRLFVRLGVAEVKITGGEPTVRPDLADVVAAARGAGPSLDLSMTTNGFLLDRLAEPLRRAGLDRITISCDSLLRHRFSTMTRRDALDRVLAGLRAAAGAGLGPIKVNCVVLRGENDDEALDFARMARSTGHQVRFIEYMPLDAEQAWERGRVVPSRELFERIHAAFPLVREGDEGSPATAFRFADGAPGGLGFISSVTEPFCDTCNRVRVTADGQLRVCLFAIDETDLRAVLREGGSDDELEWVVREAVWGKWAGHRINHPDFVRPGRSMSMIGG